MIDLNIVLFILGLLALIFVVIKYRHRIYKDGFIIGLGTGAYILMASSMVEFLGYLSEDIWNEVVFTPSAQKATIFIFSTYIFCRTTKESLRPKGNELAEKAQSLGIPSAKTDELNDEGKEKLLTYANDLIASGLYASSPSAKEKRR